MTNVITPTTDQELIQELLNQWADATRLGKAKRGSNFS
jgi:hypothetical protein